MAVQGGHALQSPEWELIFLHDISQAFEAKREELLTEDAGAAEDPDEYRAENVFWVPKEARWSHLQANA